ncbi:MAG: fumarylacetoacetate hydrolase family protein [Negativicutes bacterium]|nr:fumarylacetoacetate hydrolase family protein [Negativicutes bacterium]
MKLCRFGRPGREKPGIWLGDEIYDLSTHFPDWSPASLGDGRLFDRLAQLPLAQLDSFPADSVRLGCPVAGVGKLVCLGYNSRRHAEQFGLTIVEATHKPHVFLKATSALCGAGDPIIYTRLTGKLDWEGELAVIIGRRGKYIDPAESAGHIFGYACFNDLSDRYWQFEAGDGQYARGKSFDSFAPLGPVIVTADEIDDPGRLSVRLWVNGQLRQAFSTADYIYSPFRAVSFLSQFFTLEPGDVIAMGSPPGNAAAWGNAWLRPGDIVELTIDGLGRQRQLVVHEDERGAGA